MAEIEAEAFIDVHAADVQPGSATSAATWGLQRTNPTAGNPTAGDLQAPVHATAQPADRAWFEADSDARGRAGTPCNIASVDASAMDIIDLLHTIT